jgi:capsular exopolysaccharide synthesis family protein
MELKLIGQILRRWSWLLVIGILVGGGVGYAIGLYQTPEYDAETKVLVMEPMQEKATNGNALNDKEMARTYVELLFTQPVIEATGQKIGSAISTNQIKAVQVRDTGLLEITVRDSDPVQAALIANTLVEVLIEQNDALQMSRFSSFEESLKLQVEDIEQQLSNLENKVETRSQQNVEDENLAVNEQKAALEQQIFTLQAEITGLQQDVDDLTPDALPNELPPPLTPEQRSLLNEKRTQLAQKQFLLELASQTYFNLSLPPAGGENPGNTAAELQDIEQANLELYRQLYSTLLSNYEAVRLARLQNTPNVVQVEKATPPDTPVQAGPFRNVILGALLGLLATGALAFTLEYLDDTLKTPQDIAHVLELPVVGHVVNESAIGKNDGVPYVASHPRSPMAETFRTLRTNLEFAGVDRPLKTILVTSPGTGEGKTTVAINLAAAMAQANKRVILLEGDLRRPRLHQALAMSNQSGLTDVFRGQLDIRDVARYSKVKGMAVITSGSLPPNPAELLGSARMATILSRLVETASVVVIDSPPFVVADSTVLAARVDGVLLVIRPGKTNAEAARAMLAQLNRAGANVIGVVLNRVSRKNGSYYGYYQYDSEMFAATQPTPVEPTAARRRKGWAALFRGPNGVSGKVGEEVTS